MAVVHVNLDRPAAGPEYVLRVRGLEHVDDCDHGALVAALGAHLGLDAVALRKAVAPKGGKQPDARFPALRKLIEQARREWDRYGDGLVEAVLKLLRDGRLLPLSPEADLLLRDLFQAHSAAILVRLTGRFADPDDAGRVRAAGLLPFEGPGLLPAGWHLGRAIDARGLESAVVQGRDSLAEMLRRVVRPPATSAELASMDYVQRRGMVFMRRPVDAVAGEVQRVLTDAEYGLLRGRMRQDVEARDGWRRVARDLKDAVQGNPSLTNDWDRVARTELAFAHAHGALETVREEARILGQADPEVYKLVSPDACRDCRRIWGPNEAPKRYRLSEVERRNDGHGNFGLSRAEWGPTPGPVHPNCTEGPLHLYDAAVHGKVIELATKMRRQYGD